MAPASEVATCRWYAVEMEKAAARAAEAVECYIEKGPDKAMNLYNTK